MGVLSMDVVVGGQCCWFIFLPWLISLHGVVGAWLMRDARGLLVDRELHCGRYGHKESPRP